MKGRRAALVRSASVAEMIAVLAAGCSGDREVARSAVALVDPKAWYFEAPEVEL